ncbi:beta-1,3-galactosyltransferase 4-like [Hyposmocoma kahamanoa]|uniref:beta-1,3-galactosyltransferase 4-like n=1 Tax=Hyposmocoma kahamanoa TaxID=1477025 RepID=UPI000E6D9E40|nr:beta-1,3-galactosyltransferase 4-like [Hyposmocoma kahamanoa]
MDDVYLLYDWGKRQLVQQWPSDRARSRQLHRAPGADERHLRILVASAPGHVEERNAIRQTWGSHAGRADVAMAFRLGSSPASKRAKLAAEDTLFGDLIIGNSVDSYRNLTFKTLSPRVLKTDDDVFVNVPRLLQCTSATQRAKATRALWGSLIILSPKPNRSKRSRYYVSPVQFPAAGTPSQTPRLLSG